MSLCEQILITSPSHIKTLIAIRNIMKTDSDTVKICYTFTFKNTFFYQSFVATYCCKDVIDTILFAICDLLNYFDTFIAVLQR